MTEKHSSKMKREEQIELLILTGDGITGKSIENKSFAQTLTAVVKERGYTIFEASQITRHPSRTLENWASGHRVPTKQIRDKTIADLSDPANPPSARVQKMAEKSHHLSWDQKKGWKLKITIDRGPKFNGKQVQEWMRTRDLKEAIARKELIIAHDTGRLGLKIQDRRQKRTKGIAKKLS